jgi:quercetin dioxygenase-like cupin family protein
MNVYHTHDLAAAAVAANPSRPATALVHDATDARVVLFRLEPGQEVPVHTSTSTVLLTVLSGTGTVVGANGEQTARAGDMVAYETEEPHGMRAHAEQFVIAAVIAPRPGTARGG